MDNSGIMQETQVAANAASRIPYSFPSNAVVEVQVFAPQPVSVYVVDDCGLAAFSAGAATNSAWATSEDQTAHAMRLRLPPRSQWNVLIVNRSAAPVMVNYDATIAGYMRWVNG